jgi:hypothetical protein
VVVVVARSLVQALHTSLTLPSMSTNCGCSSRLAPFSSPLKLPLPTYHSRSVLRRHNLEIVKPLPQLGPMNTSGVAGRSRATSGFSLSTLSHTLDKLVVPPSRPNSSLGFVEFPMTTEPKRAAKWKRKMMHRCLRLLHEDRGHSHDPPLRRSGVR